MRVIKVPGSPSYFFFSWDMGSPIKSEGLQWICGGLQRDAQRGLQWKGVSNSTPRLKLSNNCMFQKQILFVIEKNVILILAKAQK